MLVTFRLSIFQSKLQFFFYASQKYLNVKFYNAISFYQVIVVPLKISFSLFSILPSIHGSCEFSIFLVANEAFFVLAYEIEVRSTNRE